MKLPKFLPDNFSLLLISTVIFASILPVRRENAEIFSNLTDVAIGLLFFLHGVKLSREAVIEGIIHWRLHLTIFVATFVIYPLVGLLLKPVITFFLPNELYLGFLYLCLLPSTVQSSIAFVSIAKGNISAAICSASASNLIGIILTPFLVSVFLASNSTSTNNSSFETIIKITFLLLLPFILGQLFRNKLINIVQRNASLLKIVDQGSILMVVYSAFSTAVVQGVWQQISWNILLIVIALCLVLLGIVMLILYFFSRKLGFNHADQITILFCGSKKTLASGIPMAKIIFAGHPFGLIILPLMLFHQIQLLVCSILASYFAKSDKT